MKFGLTDKDWNILNEKMIRPLQEKGATVWVFGSRATGTHKKFSDIDLLYQPITELPLHFLFEIKSEIEESDLPIKVDLVSITDLAESYRERAFKERVKL